MATDTRGGTARPTAERPDAQYAFVAGLYVAALLVPAVVVGLSRLVDDAAVLYVGFLVAVAGITALGGWTAARTPGLATGLGRRDAVWALVVLPFGWFGGVVAGVALGFEPPDVVVPLATFGTAAGALVGLALVAMSRTRYADAVLADATDRVAWEARWPRRWRRAALGVSVGAFAVSTAGIVAALGFGVEWGWQLYYLLIVGAVAMNVLNPRTFRVTDRGLVVEHPLQRQFRPWSAYETYERTDDALVIRPTAWWRPAHRCDAADVEDLDTTLAALDEVLPRQR